MSEFNINLSAFMVLVFAVYALFHMFNLQELAYKTLFALSGTGLVFSALNLIGSAIGSTLPTILVITVPVLTIWSFLVFGYILGKALNKSTFKGVLFMLGIGMLQGMVVTSIFGVQAIVALPTPVSLPT